MIIKYLFSAPNRDIVLNKKDLEQPFKLTPSRNHCFLTLGDYFKAIENFILRDHGIPLSSLLNERFCKNIRIDQSSKILIRSEKHGALYHLSSIEIRADKQPIKLSVSTAVSEQGKTCLAQEYETLNTLKRTLSLSCLPKPFCLGEENVHAGTGEESLLMLLCEWFDGYHEWHLTTNGNDSRQKICLWDLKNGHHEISKEDSFEIFKQASKILTLHYNTRTFCQIYPWHHAAGDFVVRIENGIVDVKLTTARKYGSAMVFCSEAAVNPMVAILFFFIHLTIKMRLDKLNGVDNVAWVDDFSVRAVIDGFFEALMIMDTEGRYSLGKVQDLLLLLKSLSREELEGLCHSLSDLLRQEEHADFLIIEANLKNHIRQLHDTIQSFHLKPPSLEPAGI